MGPYADITFFTKYQTFLVGLLGFLGVMATLWWNARLARVARIEAAAHERATLRVAIIEELKLVKAAFELRISQSDPKTADYSYIPKRQLPSTIYDKLVDRIGLLTSEEVAAVMHAYGLLEQLPERLGLISEEVTEHDGVPSHMSDSFFIVKSEHMDEARRIHESYLKVIEVAINKLTANMPESKARR